MRVFVTGATAWADAESIRRELSALPAGSVLIHGDAPGADALAGQIGHELGMVVIRMAKNAEDYRRFGRPAWKGLNERMLQQGVELVLAFHTELGDTTRAARPPRAWLQASSATIYAHRYDAPNDEASGILGGAEPNAPDTWRFSIDVAKAWERAATAAATPQTRLVLLRSAMVMSPDRGGVFDVLLGLVRLGLGGSVAGGRQYVSWMHDQDFVRAIAWLLDHDELAGSVNLAAPNPLPYRDFMRGLRRAYGVPVGLPATGWMVELGTFAMRTESELVLKSRRVVPGRLAASGFTFAFPDWPAAAADLCRRWRSRAENPAFDVS